MFLVFPHSEGFINNSLFVFSLQTPWLSLFDIYKDKFDLLTICFLSSALTKDEKIKLYLGPDDVDLEIPIVFSTRCVPRESIRKLSGQNSNATPISKSFILWSIIRPLKYLNRWNGSEIGIVFFRWMKVCFCEMVFEI